MDSSPDNEVAFYTAQSTHLSDLTCEELAKSLRKWAGLSKAICKVLRDNKIHGKTFVNLTQSDLTDLPSDFKDRKELWDCHEEMDQTPLESFLKALESNDPQLIFYQGNTPEGVDDPSSHQKFIVVDKEVLLECKSITGRDALISLLAVHYALNLKYHSTHMSMFKFIEEHVLGVMPRRKSYAYRKIENALLSKLKDGSDD